MFHPDVLSSWACSGWVLEVELHHGFRTRKERKERMSTLNQVYYQVIPIGDYAGCIWGVYLDPAAAKAATDNPNEPQTGYHAVLLEGLITTVPPLENPPSIVLYVNVDIPDDTLYQTSLYREGVQGKLTPADQALQVSVSFNLTPGAAIPTPVPVILTCQNRPGFQIINIDRDPGAMKFSLRRKR